MFVATTWFTPSVETRQRLDSAMLTSSVRQIAELSTLVFGYNEVIIFEDQQTFTVFGAEVNIPGTARRFIVKFEGEMRFGIETGGIRAEIIEYEGENEGRYEILVHMPRVSILTHHVDIDSINLLDETTGLFVSFDLEDYTYFISARQQEVEAQEGTTELLSRAEQSAEEAVYALLRLVAPEEDYLINFIWMN